jgi:hypothetical protein
MVYKPLSFDTFYLFVYIYIMGYIHPFMNHGIHQRQVPLPPACGARRT